MSHTCLIKRELRDNIYKMNQDETNLDYETKLLNSVLLVKNYLKGLIKRASDLHWNNGKSDEPYNCIMMN